jgi:hypothetical protein
MENSMSWDRSSSISVSKLLLLIHIDVFYSFKTTVCPSSAYYDYNCLFQLHAWNWHMCVYKTYAVTELHIGIATGNWRLWYQRQNDQIMAYTLWCVLVLTFEELIVHHLKMCHLSGDSAHILCSLKMSLYLCSHQTVTSKVCITIM